MTKKTGKKEQGTTAKAKLTLKKETLLDLSPKDGRANQARGGGGIPVKRTASVSG